MPSVLLSLRKQYVPKDEAFVKEICSIAEKYLPDYDEDKIYDEWK